MVQRLLVVIRSQLLVPWEHMSLGGNLTLKGILSNILVSILSNILVSILSNILVSILNGILRMVYLLLF